MGQEAERGRDAKGFENDGHGGGGGVTSARDMAAYNEWKRKAMECGIEFVESGDKYYEGFKLFELEEDSEEVRLRGGIGYRPFLAASGSDRLGDHDEGRRHLEAEEEEGDGDNGDGVIDTLCCAVDATVTNNSPSGSARTDGGVVRNDKKYSGDPNGRKKPSSTVHRSRGSRVSVDDVDSNGGKRGRNDKVAGLVSRIGDSEISAAGEGSSESRGERKSARSGSGGGFGTSAASANYTNGSGRTRSKTTTNKTADAQVRKNGDNPRDWRVDTEHDIEDDESSPPSPPAYVIPPVATRGNLYTGGTSKDAKSGTDRSHSPQEGFSRIGMMTREPPVYVPPGGAQEDGDFDYDDDDEGKGESGGGRSYRHLRAPHHNRPVMKFEVKKRVSAGAEGDVQFSSESYDTSETDDAGRREAGREDGKGARGAEQGEEKEDSGNGGDIGAGDNYGGFETQSEQSSLMSG